MLKTDQIFDQVIMWPVVHSWYRIYVALASLAGCNTHMQHWRFEAELAEGISQGLLGNRELSELIGQRLSQLGHVLVALPVISEQLEARL